MKKSIGYVFGGLFGFLGGDFFEPFGFFVVITQGESPLILKRELSWRWRGTQEVEYLSEPPIVGDEGAGVVTAKLPQVVLSVAHESGKHERWCGAEGAVELIDYVGVYVAQGGILNLLEDGQQTSAEIGGVVFVAVQCF